MSYVKVYKYKKQISLDNGVTWYDVTPEEYVPSGDPIGYYDTLEECLPKYRTIDSTTCVGVNKHEYTIYQISYDDGETWETYSASTGSVIEYNSYDCGYRERWIESGTTCIGSDKYTKNNKFVSYDSGSTWIDTGEYSAKTLIETDSEECFTSQYFTVVARENNLAFKTNKSISYSVDSGLTWVRIGPDASVPVLSEGDKIMFKEAGLYVQEEAGNLFYDYTGDFDIEGNIMSLWDGDNFAEDTETGYPWQLGSLFAGSPVVNAKNLVLPKNNSSFCYLNMFSGCNKLITAPKLPSIGILDHSYEGMFRNCTSLVEAPLIYAANRMSASACSEMFMGCTSLTSATINDIGAEYGPSRASYFRMFSGCSSLNQITYICKDLSSTTNYTRWSWVDGVSNNGTFIKSPNITSWVTGIDGIPSGWTVADYITEKFKLTLNDSSTVSAACDSTSESEITRADISAYTSTLVSTEIGECVSSIGDYAFNLCTSLTSITIPNSVASIGQNAFYMCTGFPSITIPDSVTSIGESAFGYCTSLTSINIPSGVTSIGEWVFSNCTSLTSITIPNSVTSIGESAFYNCYSLSSVTIPNSVTSIGVQAFERCLGLTSITIPDSVTSIGSNAFYGCSGLTSINIPNSVTTIGGSAFASCSGLTSCTIGNSVTSIGTNAFTNCTSLTSVTIPYSVTIIGERAFRYCSGLTSITVNTTTPPALGNQAFYGSTCNIYVPASAVNTYKNASGWNSYSSRIQAIP